jgi:hypothetical protein
MKAFLGLACCATVLAVSGCAYYVAPDGTVVPAGFQPAATAPASFDRSFAAAAGAMRDEGLTVTVEDRATGNVVGSGDGGTVTATLQQQADGSVRVQFGSRAVRDPDLITRVSRYYERRMGR